MLTVPLSVRRGDVVAVKSNSEFVVADLAVAVGGRHSDVLFVAVLLLLGTGIARVRLLPPECHAASHRNHRQKSP